MVEEGKLAMHRIPRPILDAMTDPKMRQRAHARECGECDVCCVYLPITTEGFSKPKETPCQHLREGVCSIYSKKPDLCGDFFCTWRAGIGPREDRPDLSGFIGVMNDKTEDGEDFVRIDIYETREGVDRQVMGNHAVECNQRFVTLVRMFPHDSEVARALVCSEDDPHYGELAEYAKEEGVSSQWIEG